MKKESSHQVGHRWFDGSDLLNQLMLILVGAVILMVNFGFLSSSVYAYWPILVIIIGLRALLHNK